MTIGVASASPAARISSASATALGWRRRGRRASSRAAPPSRGSRARSRCPGRSPRRARARGRGTARSSRAARRGRGSSLSRSKAGEAGQVQPAVEDQRGLEAAVGEERTGGVELGKAVAMAHRATLPEAVFRQCVGAHNRQRRLTIGRSESICITHAYCSPRPAAWPAPRSPPASARAHAAAAPSTLPSDPAKAVCSASAAARRRAPPSSAAARTTRTGSSQGAGLKLRWLGFIGKLGNGRYESRA